MSLKIGKEQIHIAGVAAGLFFLGVTTCTSGCNRNKGADAEFDSLRLHHVYQELAADSEPAAEAEPIAVAGTPTAPSVSESENEKYENGIKQGPRFHDRIRINRIGHLRDVFNDSNYLQIQYAQKLGIEPIHGLRSAYHTRRPIIKIESNKYYEVDSLTHSLPYLVPEAAKLLQDVGANFIDSLRKRGADGYRIIATSLLRTPHTVKRLRRVNVNATDSSTHQYGTTFDLSYTRFLCLDSTRTINEEDLKNLLAEVLLDLRNQNRCLVKFERKTGCFHVTAAR